MSQNRKRTAYRKSRKFGDVHGGRRFPKVTDRVFNRAHSLPPPGPHDELPILIQDNPSRDFFFPLTVEEAREALQALPKKHHAGITHLWLRRDSTQNRIRSDAPLAEFICGSGVRLIVLYPWRRDLRMCLGRLPPVQRFTKTYGQFGAEIVRQRGWWYVIFDLKGLRRFYVEYLLYHEVGHHIDYYRRLWSAANRSQQEDFADQYAVQWSRTAKYVLNRLDKTSPVLAAEAEGDQ